jgi:hypothetical protein
MVSNRNFLMRALPTAAIVFENGKSPRLQSWAWYVICLLVPLPSAKEYPMSTTVSSAIAASFPSRGQAEVAIDELYHSGFAREKIGIAAPGSLPRRAQTASGKLEERGGEGAAVGAATGGVAGAILGSLVAATLPGVGLILTGGLIAEIILATAAGAAAGSYLGPFIAIGLSEREAEHFSSELKAGHTLVFLKAFERAPQAIEILQRHGGHTLEAV